MKVAIGSDHAGYELKQEIMCRLNGPGYEWIDCGTFSSQSVDYPDIAEAVAEKVLQESIFGVLICGTGTGISIAANKFPGIRAAACHDVNTARLAREHNDANIIAMGARTTESELALQMVEIFLKTDFQAGRHSKRVEKISNIEKKIMKE